MEININPHKKSQPTTPPKGPFGNHPPTLPGTTTGSRQERNKKSESKELWMGESGKRVQE